MNERAETSCPCFSALPYKHCCMPLHQGKKAASDARALMRSRYSAYALRKVDYLISTTHKENPAFRANKSVWQKSLLEFASNTHFQGLKIVEFQDGENLAFVTFTAFLRQGSIDASFSEKSLFEKVKGKWLYKSGEIFGFLL